jgi:hypothetical protein
MPLYDGLAQALAKPSAGAQGGHSPPLGFGHIFNTGKTRPERGRGYNRGRGRYRNRNRSRSRFRPRHRWEPRANRSPTTWLQAAAKPNNEKISMVGGAHPTRPRMASLWGLRMRSNRRAASLTYWENVQTPGVGTVHHLKCRFKICVNMFAVLS